MHLQLVNGSSVIVIILLIIIVIIKGQHYLFNVGIHLVNMYIFHFEDIYDRLLTGLFNNTTMMTSLTAPRESESFFLSFV